MVNVQKSGELLKSLIPVKKSNEGNNSNDIFFKKWALLLWTQNQAISIWQVKQKYYVVMNASPSYFEAHVCLFRLLMKGIFDPYVLWPFDKKLVF